MTQLLDDFTVQEIDFLLDNIDELDPYEQEELLKIVDILEARQIAQEAHDDLITFCKRMQPDYKVGPHHRRLASLLMQIERGEKDRISVSIAPRHGKQLAHDTWVPTPEGYKLHGDLRPGDYVFGLDGKPAKVLAISPESDQDVEVEFSNGEVIRCHENHEWSAYDSRRFHKTAPLETRETWEFEGDLWKGEPGKRGSRCHWRLPDNFGVEYPERELPLHPYALGVWLGDGATTKAAITGIDEPIFEKFSKVSGFTESGRWVHKDTEVTTVSYSGPKPNVRGQLSLALFELGLLGVCRTGVKFIPEIYQRSSREQRLELLAGLIDTDGNVELATGRCRIVTACFNLADGIRELAAGLGFRPYVTTQNPCLSSSGIEGRRVVYTVGFQPHEPIPTALERKRILKISKRRRISITTIRRVETHKGRCIQVEREDGLYLVGRTHIPTHNSQLVSIYFPAWFLGRNPTKQVMMVSHTADLAVDFGRKVRNLIDSEIYKEIFPGVSLAADSKSAGRWNTNKGGVYYATGVGSSIAGRGADLLVVDDAISEQDILTGGLEVLQKVYEWFAYGARTRLMPKGAVAIVGTRWHASDLIGRVIKDMALNELADQYEVVEFPAILEVPDPDDPERTIEKALWPEFFDLEALYRTRASMPAFQWSAQYQQKPTSEAGAIVKREWWRRWTHEKPPKCEFIIMSLDSAAEKHNRADYTSFSIWGVFFNEEEDAYQIILLNAVKDRYEFPELKAKAMELYSEWEPDSFIVEKKSSGVAIYQEMRRMGIPVQEFTPHRGTGDKHARLNAVADMIASGMVWVPDTRWAEELVEEVAAFPFGANDDQVDSTVMALMRFRQGGFIRLPSDVKDEVPDYRRPSRGYY